MKKALSLAALLLSVLMIVMCCAACGESDKKDDTTAANANTGESGQDTPDDQPEINNKQITEISAGRRHTVGLRADGTIVAVGKNKKG